LQDTRNKHELAAEHTSLMLCTCTSRP
jgi:hypothetical protein